MKQNAMIFLPKKKKKRTHFATTGFYGHLMYCRFDRRIIMKRYFEIVQGIYLWNILLIESPIKLPRFKSYTFNQNCRQGSFNSVILSFVYIFSCSIHFRNLVIIGHTFIWTEASSVYFMFEEIAILS